MSWFERLFSRFSHLAVPVETDVTFPAGRSFTHDDRDRYPFELREILEQSLEAWRLNPLARRIVSLTTQYVVGAGLAITCKHPRTSEFLRKFWDHPLNRMDTRVMEWCDELSRTGNLFILLSTDSAGMSYVRAIPASQVDRIECRPNDVEQPTRFILKASFDQLEPQTLPAYDPFASPPAEGFSPVMLHYAINRPVGAQWGEPDLAPLLKWISRYSAWLEDRARLNRFRNSFLFVVKSNFSGEAQRLARQAQLNANPPAPGSILVTAENESWSVIEPKLESADANTDGLALKKMLSAGAGLPLHFLAEPESSTRTTAEAAGGPTFRHFEQRQNFFLWLVKDVLRVVVERRGLIDRRVHPDAVFEVTGSDISARDNAALAIASASIMAVLEKLRDRALIDDAELLRLLYRFAGEPLDANEMLHRGESAPAPIRYDLLQPDPAASGPELGRVAIPLPTKPSAGPESTRKGIPHPENPLDTSGETIKPGKTGES